MSSTRQTCSNEELRREVALKLIQEQFADDTDSRDRFLFEAEITGRLRTPNPEAAPIPQSRGRGSAPLPS